MSNFTLPNLSKHIAISLIKLLKLMKKRTEKVERLKKFNMGKTGKAYEKFMQEKFRLIDGTQAFALRKLKCEKQNKKAFQCLCCRVDEMVSVKQLLNHVKGTKHKKNLERSHDPKFITINERAEGESLKIIIK
jgi:type IV secretory pathway VirB4 component